MIASTARAYYGDLSVNLLLTTDDSNDEFTLGSTYLLTDASAGDLVQKAIYSEFLNKTFVNQNEVLTRFAELGGNLQVVCTQESNVIDPNPALTIEGGKPAVVLGFAVGLVAVRISLQHSISG